MTRLVQIPEIPSSVDSELATVLQAMKQNIDTLAGLSGIDKMAQAVKYGEVQVADITQQSVDAAADPPTQAEFNKVIDDLEEIVRLHNYLAAQLRGEEVGT